MKESIKGSPKSAMAFYVKIYCHKQSKKKNRQYNMIEATKSWISLSKIDKQYFVNAFKEYKTNIKKCFALNLQSTELYMKKKQGYPRRSCKSKAPSIVYNQPPADNAGIYENSPTVCNNMEDVHNEIDISCDNEQLVQTIPLENVTNTSIKTDVPRLPSEPTPPVRSSMELFAMIKHNDGSTHDLSWADLNKLQKQRYQRALLSIKKDYIKQYNAYLEQLTPEQLFHYYKSKC